jgi:proteasome lid subunit RPN8/RPN11
VVNDGLTLPVATADELLTHARAEVPNEACGILSGTAATATAATYYSARNADASPYVYTVHPDDLVRIVLAIDEMGEDLVAIFHSHTHSPAVPSPTDRRQAHYPDAIYLLASLAEPSAEPASALRAWRIHDGEAAEIPVRLR